MSDTDNVSKPDTKIQCQTVSQTPSTLTPGNSLATPNFPKWLRELFNQFRGTEPQECFQKTIAVANLSDLNPSQSDGLDDWLKDVFQNLHSGTIQRPLGGELTILDKRDLPHLPTKLKYASLISPPHQNRLGWSIYDFDKAEKVGNPKTITFYLKNLKKTETSGGDLVLKKPSESI